MGIQINGSNDTIQADDGSLSLAGSVSYEDVTNVTSVGLSTFSSGIHIDDSITHLGDTDTKIRFPAADTVTVETGGNERVRIDSDGNFGLGAAATNYSGYNTLMHNASTGATFEQRVGGTLKGSLTTDTQVTLKSLTSIPLVFATANTERLRIDSSGRVGIDNVSPGNKLSVSNAGAESFDINPGSVANNNIVLHYNWSGSNYVTAETRAAEHVFEIGTSEAMRINSSGVLTVGTTAAGSNAKFEVASTTGSISSATARINGGSTTSGAINTGASLLFAGHDGANGRDFASLFAGKENGTSGNHAAYLAFGTRVNGGSTTEKMRLDSAGKLGLGTNSPKRQLHINGGNETVKIQITNTTTGSANDGEGFQIGIAANGNAFLEQRESLPLIFYTSNTEAMRIDSSRRLMLGTTTEGHSNADDLTVSNGGDGGITIRSGSSFNGNIYFSDGTSGADEYRGIVRYAHSSDALDFYSNAQHRMRIDSSGRLLVGTSTDTTARLVVKGAAGSGDDGINVISGSTTTGSKAAIFFSPSTTGSFSTGSAIKAERLSPDGSDLQFYTCTALGSASTERMRIDSAGRMSLGTTTPVNIGAGYEGLTINASTAATLYLQGGGTSGGRILANGSDLFLGPVQSNGSTIIQRAHGSYETARFDSSGRLLIGTNTQSTTAKFVIQGQTDGANVGGYMRIQTGSSVTNDHALGTISFGDGSHNGANIQARGDMAWNPFGKGSSLRFSTTGQSQTGPQERMRIDSSGRMGLGTSSPDQLLHLESSSSFLAISNSGDSGTAGILFRRTDNNHNRGNITYNFDTDFMAFRVSNNGAGESMRIDSSGSLIVGTGSGSAPNGTSLGGSGFIHESSNRKTLYLATTTNSAGLARFYNTNGQVGTITVSGSSTSYNTSSDHRLKENVVNIADGITRVKQLAPKRFNFIADADTTVDGFLAHEAQTVVPEAVTGTHNEVDEDGNAVMQGIDQSKLVPLLTAALQEAIAEIESLKARVTTLEG